MLKKWIEEIRNQSDLYKADTWKYHVSGNTVEFSIVPAYLKDKNTYRMSVIAVGQVLKAISCCIERQQLHYHIQSFPTLENPGFVATLRMYENSISVRNNDKNSPLKKMKSETAIRTLAKYYQLNIQEIKDPVELHRDNVNLYGYSCYVLYSTFNNPFTWLNIGYWKEEILNDCHHLLPRKEYKIIDLYSMNMENRPDIQIPKNKYIQSIVGIKPAAVES